ncbi:hypothetical protein O3P69_014502 [Scylla paramamosain]|uniref:Endoglucanase n=1 Tax=Scylla paramamosain TaxID=85552 RepID=A0AAW0TBE2_SCYPA
MAGAITVLAWGAVEYGEAYKAAGELANVRAAVKWATDYFLKAHVAPSVFYGQVGIGDLDHAYWGRPEDMDMYRPAYKITESKPGSDLAGETAAALAAASILFKDSDSAYSDDCLLHARQLYSFADNFRGKYSDSIPDAANFYYSWGVYDDELAWAALWLYRATGEETFLTQAKAHYSNIYTSGVQEFSWAEKTPGAMVLLAQLTDAPEKQTYLQDLEGFCDRIINEKPRTPKGLVYLSQWGSLRYAANVAFVCLRAADLGIKSETYRTFGKQQIHYMLGSTGRSFVVGFGNNPPQRPHHASSSCKDPPASCTWDDFNSPAPNPHILYGALVGGPGQDDSYADVRSDYIKNEVTCDYNAGFQSAVAALRQLAGCGGSTATTAAPDTTTTPVTTRPPGTTQSPVTTKAPTTPGPQPTTDGGGSSSCDINDMVQQTNEWSGNFQANLVVKIPVNSQSWSITLTFSSTVTQFQVWTADASATPSSTITLTNKSYNGMQTAGNTLTINFIASYSGAKPEVTSITFNGTPLCSTGITAAPDTTTTSTTTTHSPVTTSGPQPTTDGGGSSSCDINDMVQQTNEWSGNFQANLVVKIPVNSQSWSITLTFSSTVTQFQVWVADASATPSSTITLTNKSYNGLQKAGNTLTINFIASYNGAKPEVTSVAFNDDVICLN